MNTDTERFITAIRQAIERELDDQADAHNRPDRYRIWINTDQLARTAHRAVINHLGPPF